MWKVSILLLLYTAAGVRSEFLMSFVDVSRPTVHCKVRLLSSPKAWLFSFKGLVRHCVYHTTWVLFIGWCLLASSQCIAISCWAICLAFEAWLATFDGQLHASSLASHIHIKHGLRVRRTLAPWDPPHNYTRYCIPKRDWHTYNAR